MDIFEWESGTIIERPYVEIDGTKYYVQDGEISGGTPATANNLNEMQNILNDNISENVLDKYSTDETIIGVWIDNKPIYRKVLVNTLSNENNMFSLSSIGLSNASTYIKLKSICNGNPIEEDYFESSADSIRTFINQNGLNINLGSSFPSKPCIVITIIEYTKITD